MATVILDVPTEKIQSFVSMILQLGIDKHRITSRAFNSEPFPQTLNEKQLKNFNAIRRCYWDWDLHISELEFE